MKQYKLIIRENSSENLSGILNKEAKGGWKLNSYESSKPASKQEMGKQRMFLVFEK